MGTNIYSISIYSIYSSTDNRGNRKALKGLIVKRQQKRRRAIAVKFSIYYRCFFFLHNEAKKYL